MKKSLLIAVFGLLALALTVPAAYAAGTGTLSGKAVRWNGEAIPGATIGALGGPLETDKERARPTTAADGSYPLTVPAGLASWIHIDTFGSWWGYSYQTPFTLSDGET